LNSLCNFEGSRVTCWRPSPLISCGGPWRYFRSECCIDGSAWSFPLGLRLFINTNAGQGDSTGIRAFPTSICAASSIPQVT